MFILLLLGNILHCAVMLHFFVIYVCSGLHCFSLPRYRKANSCSGYIFSSSFPLVYTVFQYKRAKIVKISPCLSKLQLAKVGAFLLRHRF